MRLKHLTVKNFRCIKNESLSCENLTALVGANGCGKSTFLRAIDLFYSTSLSISEDDFFGRETGVEISISLTYDSLPPEAVEKFSSYIERDTLTVEKVITLRDGRAQGTYHGSKLQNPDFVPVRVGTTATIKGDAYKALLQDSRYSGLPPWKNATSSPDNLTQWELQNPQSCQRIRDNGQFFGFTSVGIGYLGQFTKHVFIPAVRDAIQDGVEGRGSVLTVLMDLVIRSVLAQKQDVLRLKEDTQNRYRQIMDPSALTELRTLSDELSEGLKVFVPTGGVNLNWLPLGDLQIPMPQAKIRIKEDGYEAPIEKTGHGTQRAFILALLQHLVRAQAIHVNHDEATEEEVAEVNANPHRLPSLLLLIEEPELYQHPSRQRHLANILLKLSNGQTPGVADKTQIIYATHSPFFVGLDRFDQIRLVRKVLQQETSPKATCLVAASLNKVADHVWRATGAQGTPFTGESLRPRLHSIMTPMMNEGFFADLVVLVEGEDDRAAILGIAGHLNTDLESRGIAVIPCGGKASLDRPFSIFSQLGIPVYLVWDSDEGGTTQNQNHLLLRLVGATVEDWPATVTDTYSCFKTNLEKTMEVEIGTSFQAYLGAAQTEYQFQKKTEAVKCPSVITEILKAAARDNKRCTSLENILTKILALHGRSNESAIVSVEASPSSERS